MHADVCELGVRQDEELIDSAGEREARGESLILPLRDGAVDGPVATAELLGQCEALSVSGPRAEAVVETWALVEIKAEADSPIVLEPLKVALLRVANAVPVVSTDGELETVPHKEAAVEGELPLPLDFGLTEELAAPEGEPALLGDATPETLLLPLAEGATLVLALPHSDLVETPLGETPLPLEFGLADGLAAPESEPALLGDVTPETLLLPLAEGATLALALPHNDLVEMPLGETPLPLEFGLADGLAASEGEPALLSDATPETLLLPLAEGATLALALPHSDLVETPLGETPLPLEFGLADGLAAPEGEPALLSDVTPETLLLPLAEGATLALALPHSDPVETPLGDSTWVVVGPPELVTVAVEEAEAHKVIELVKLVVKQTEGAPLALLDAQIVASGEYESEAEPQPEAEGRRLSEEKADMLGVAGGDLEYKPDAVAHREGNCDGVLQTDSVTVVVEAGEEEAQGEEINEAVGPPVGDTDPDKGSEAENELLCVPRAVCEGLPLPLGERFKLPEAAAEELAALLGEAAGDTVGHAEGE